MKRITLAVLLSIGTLVRAQEISFRAPEAQSSFKTQETQSNPLLDLGGLGDFVSSMAHQAKGATLANIKGEVAAGLYVPIWTLHDLKGVQYLELAAGGALNEGGKGEPLCSLTFNLPGISRRLTNSEWFNSHVTRISLPDIWFGPYIKAPTTQWKDWRGLNEIGVIVSVGLGKNPNR